MLNTIQKEIRKGDYLYALVPEHPNANKNNYVLYHRIVMENYLNRYLDSCEEVHHIDNNKHNNNIDNLELTLKGKHQQFHRLQKGRQYVRLQCPSCNCIFDRPENQTHLVKWSKYEVTCCCKICRGQFYRQIQLFGITEEIQEKIDNNIMFLYRT